MTTEYAQQNGFVPLTNGYKLPREKWMMDSVIKDAEQNNKEILVVFSNEGAELWQKQKAKQTPTQE